MSSEFSARPTIMGFNYQFKIALLLILSSDEGATASIETNDDIEIGSADNSNLIQVKHHESSGKISDSSVDFWKSIRIWSDFLNSVNNATKYILFTTDTSSPNTISSFLGTKDRNEKKATELMISFANKSQNQELKTSFKSFMNLTEDQKKELVKKITIIDSQENISNIDSVIKKEIRLSTRPEFLDSLYDRFLAWWYMTIEKHILNKNTLKLHKSDIESKLQDISDQFRLDSLPIDFLDLKPDEKMESEAEDRLFVKQLSILDIDIKMIRKAILDYYKAYSQRSRWTRENLLIEDELVKYEKKLIDSWEIILLKIKDLANKDLDENEIKKMGKNIFYEVMENDIPIREKVNEPYVMRGSYHILADEDSPRVWWHPYFKERIEQLLRVQ
jgi:hypothetical protein